MAWGSGRHMCCVGAVIAEFDVAGALYYWVTINQCD